MSDSAGPSPTRPSPAPLAVLYSRALAGVDAPLVTVEVHLGNGLPAFNIVGLAEAEVREARDRVRAALSTCGFDFPARRITVNLAPADLPKESGRVDLPIALGILVASQQLPGEVLAHTEFAGELSLTGELRPVRGALAMALGAARAGRCFILPLANAAEAALAGGVRGADGTAADGVGNVEVRGAQRLLEVCEHLAGRSGLARVEGSVADANGVSAWQGIPDLAEVRGQAAVKRALMVAAAGRHSLLMIGPPGSGKSMMAARFAGLLPPMQDEEALQAATVQSLGSSGFRVEHWRRRPFRAPHHSASATALVGGGSHPKPGEISLAHHGVLFLDELPEFDRRVLEALREPLETGKVSISRAARQAEFPADFQLLAAMNPCPCGWLGHPSGRCRCAPDRVQRYVDRISGPLLDRIDMRVEVPAVPQEELLRPWPAADLAAANGTAAHGPAAGVAGATDAAAEQSTASLRQRVIAARARQQQRQGKPNALLGAAEVEQHCVTDAAALQLLRRAARQLDLSARACHRVLKLARSIADLAAAETIASAHLAEAIQYRRFDRRT